MSFLFAHRRGYGVVPCRGRGSLPRFAERNSLAEPQRKTLRPSGANTLTQFERPGQPVPRKKVPPIKGEHADAVRAPRSAGAGKEPPVRDEPLMRFVYPGQPVSHREKNDF